MPSPPAERSPHLVLRFALYTGLALLAAALAIVWFVRRDAQVRAERAVGFHAQFIADTILRDHLAPQDLTAPVHGQRLRQLDDLMRREVLRGGALRANLYSRSGVVTYSSDHSLIGGRPIDAKVGPALVGLIDQETSHLNEEGGEGENPRILEAYVPLLAADGGRPVGVLELYQDYAPVAREIRSAVVPVAAALALALLALYASLFPILRRVTRALERRSNRLREQSEALRATNETLQALIDATPIAIQAVDPAGNVQIWNPAAERIFGWRADEVVGGPLPTVPDDDGPGGREILERALAGEPFSDLETRRLRRDGSLVDVSISAAPIHDADGALSGVVKLVVDISERKRAEDDLRRHNDELEALYRTALRLGQRLELDGVLEEIVTRAADLGESEHGFVYLVDPDGSTLTVRATTGRLAASLFGTRCGPGEGVAGRVWQTGRPMTVDDYRAWPGRRSELDDLGMRAVTAVPLHAGSEIVGVIGLAASEPGHTFDARTSALLARFGQLASLAFDNARLYTAAQAELGERRRAEAGLQAAFTRLSESEQEIELSRRETIRRLAYAVEFRDEETGRHVERMSRHCVELGRGIGLDARRCELLGLASQLHDVGKIAIADSILLKPGPLTQTERAAIEQHAEIGHRMLAGSGSELLELAATVAWTHHERFDGHGYPRGLAREQIPLEGRIAAIADVFDALTSERVYRPVFSPEDALALMRSERGTHFDPFLLDLFLELVVREGMHQAPEELTPARSNGDGAGSGRASRTRATSSRAAPRPAGGLDTLGPGAFERRFQEELQRAERAGRDLCLLVFELEGNAGSPSDPRLRELERALRAHTRAEDVVGRVSPSACGLLLPETDSEGVEAASERIRRAGLAGLEDMTVGLAVYPADGRLPADLYEAAARSLATAPGRR